MDNKAYVKNASSEKQVKKAKKKVNFDMDQRTEDLKKVLETAEGRNVLWGVLENCRAFGSVLHTSGSMTYYNAGKQDLGHQLMGQINGAGSEYLLLMMKENFKKGE